MQSEVSPVLLELVLHFALWVMVNCLVTLLGRHTLYGTFFLDNHPGSGSESFEIILTSKRNVPELVLGRRGWLVTGLAGAPVFGVLILGILKSLDRVEFLGGRDASDLGA
jgi:hypothetical protein